MGTEFRKSVLSVFEQQARMRMLLPGFDCRVRGRKHLIAEGDIRPTELASNYRVRIEYAVGDWPMTWVLTPQLVPREPGGRIPHMFNQERLCLFLTKAGEWTDYMLIATTIVPWAAEWLHYYELWHATGEWLGGGAELQENMPHRRGRDEEQRHARRRR
jgi:hypothetical protein